MKCQIALVLSLTAWNSAWCADLEYYRKQLAAGTSLVGNGIEFLLCNLPVALGDPLDMAPDGSTPADVGFMDYIPYEQYDWAPSRERVSSTYASIFTDYKLGFQRRTTEERERYASALTRLYQSPDPALLLRGQLPELRPSNRALDYFTKNELTLKRILAGDLVNSGLDGVIDAVITAGVQGEVREALRAVREFQRNDVETVWSVRSSSLSSEIFPMEVNPSRATWNNESGWGTLLIPSSRNPAIAISVQLKRVTVGRSWLDEAVFEQRNWYKSDGNRKVIMFSTGESLADLNGKTSGSLMLLLPVQFLLARKVERIGTWTVTDEQTLPLSLKPSNDDPVSGSKPVVIAVICKRVPRSPQPDPNLEWPEGLPKK